MTVKNEELSAKIDGELRMYVTLRVRAEEKEDAAKRARKEADEQRDRLWDIMEAAGVKTISGELGRMTRTVSQRAYVTDDETLAHYLSDEGILDAMTVQKWRQANLNALVGELIEAGQEIPDGLDAVAVKGIRWTRNK